MELRQPDEGIFHPSAAVLRFQSGDNESVARAQVVKLVFYNPTLTYDIEWSGQVATTRQLVNGGEGRNRAAKTPPTA